MCRCDGDHARDEREMLSAEQAEEMAEAQYQYDQRPEEEREGEMAERRALWHERAGVCDYCGRPLESLATACVVHVRAPRGGYVPRLVHSSEMFDAILFSSRRAGLGPPMPARGVR